MKIDELQRQRQEMIHAIGGIPSYGAFGLQWAAQTELARLDAAIKAARTPRAEDKPSVIYTVLAILLVIIRIIDDRRNRP